MPENMQETLPLLDWVVDICARLTKPVAEYTYRSRYPCDHTVYHGYKPKLGEGSLTLRVGGMSLSTFLLVFIFWIFIVVDFLLLMADILVNEP